MEKLIKEYQVKISALDNAIEKASQEIRNIRKGENSYMSVEEWANERKVYDAKRQCYIQFIEDLKTQLCNK